MRLLSALLAAALLLPAQTARPRRPATPPAPAAGPAITVIRIEGNKRLSADEVIAMSGIKPGAPAADRTFEAARDRLLATGCVETIAWKWGPAPQGGVEAALIITEIDQVLPWMIDRLPVTAEEFAARAAKELPCFGKQVPTTERWLGRASKLVAELARRKNFEDAVIARINIVGRDQLTVIFQPKTPPPNIAEVRFSGNEAIEERLLRRQMAEVARGVPFSELLFRQILENQLRPMYENIGRLAVRFDNLGVQPAKDVSGVVVTVEIDEGPVFTLEDVEIAGTPFSAAELEELGEFKRGEPVNYSAMGLAMQRIFARMKNSGHLQPTYTARRQINPEALTAKLFIDVDAGPQYRMGRLIIQGLDVISEPAIRKLWTMQPGDPFRGDYPDFFLQQVRERGLLDFLGETKSEVKLNEQSRTTDVTLIFRGGAQPLDSRKDRPR